MFRKFKIFSAFAVSAVLLVTYQNCSAPVTFQEPGQEQLSSLSTDAMLINGGAKYTNNKILTVQLDAANVAEMYLTEDPNCATGGEWQSYNRQTSWELKNVNSDARVYAKFRTTYQKESNCISDDIIHDDKPPILSFANAIPQKTNLASVRFGLNMSDSGSGLQKVYCSDSSVTCSSSFDFLHRAEGSQNLSVYAMDLAGNKSSTIIASWVYDKTPPVLQIVRKPALKTSALVGDFEFSATDSYSVNNSFRCSIDGGAAAPCNAVFATATLSEGNHSISVSALDDLGNQSAAQTYAWSISRNLPRITISRSPLLYTNTKGVIEFSGIDQFGNVVNKFECSLNSTTFTACSSPLDLSGRVSAEGLYVFKLRGIDNDGIISGVEERQFTYDVTAPVLSFKTKPNQFTKNNSELFEVNFVEVAKLDNLEFIFDSASVQKNTTTAYSVANIVEGAHRMDVVAMDAAGNKSATLSYNFWADYTKPTLTFPDTAFPRLVSPTASSTLKMGVVAVDNNKETANTIALAYAASEVGGLTPTLFDVFNTFVSPLDIVGLKHTTYKFKFYATDRAGNQSETYMSENVLVDLQPPTITFISQPPTDVRPNSNYTIEYLAQDSGSGLQSLKCKLTLNGNILADALCASPTAFQVSVLSEGQYEFTLTATDNVGRVATRTAAWRSAELFEQRSLTFAVQERSNLKVDILFVMDNSRSMVEENRNVAGAFSSFMDNLGGIDYRIAVTTTDVALSKSKGLLLPIGDAKSSVTYIDNQTQDALAKLQQTLQVSSNGSGTEVGLSTIRDFIVQSKIADTPQNLFYRPDAVLATVVISDSDEANFAEGFPTPEAYLNDFNSRLPNKTYIHHSNIILPGDQACLEQSGSSAFDYGVTYYGVSQLTGGNNVSICDPNYGNQLKDFATKIVAKISEQTLPCNPVDYDRNGVPDVRVNYVSQSSEIPVTNFVVNGNKVSFTSPLTSIGNYRIDFYCVK